MKLWRFVRHWLYVLHRWIGIATCLLFVVWFASGIVMMYVPYPALSERDRQARLQEIDWSQLRVTPDEARKAAGPWNMPLQVRLEMSDGQLVWRFNDRNRRLTVSAFDGHRIDGIDPFHALRAAGAEEGCARAELIERDQWTVAGSFNTARPLYRIATCESDGRVAYVASNSGELVQQTTSSQRFWNWVGAVPHWIYFTDLRKDPSLWTDVVLWVAAVAMFGAVAGAIVGVLRMRLRRRYSGNRVSPYRGWARWHHLGGLVTGLFLLTWIFSGWLSMNPLGWFERGAATTRMLDRYAGDGAARFAFEPAALRAAALPPSRSARLFRVDNRDMLVLEHPDRAPAAYALGDLSPARFSREALVAAAARMLPHAVVVRSEMLREEDAYWYGHHRTRVLPVLRIVFDDADGTWIHVDPATGEVAGGINRSGRVYRWLFAALHDFDLGLLLRNRPLWDVLVVALSIGGLMISASGVVIGLRRLRRTSRKRSCFDTKQVVDQQNMARYSAAKQGR